MIQRALLSVFDKTGLIPFAQALADAGIELISTGGTARALRQHGIMVSDLSAYTGFPEMMDGRVKTLHPRIHGGLLYVRGNPGHEAAARKHDIKPIDLVVVNLYPFEETIARPGVTLAEAIENIDIGGPAMLRSAAKNHESVTVVVDPSDYARVAAQITANGNTTPELRRLLAQRVFARTSAYDGQIAAYLAKTYGLTAAPAAAEPLPERLCLDLPRAQGLRYGENPHQRAALYGRFGEFFQQLHGRELSYNNILDLTAAAGLAGEFAGGPPALAILKHTNACGAGQGATLREAWEKAFATDKQAPFGGVIAVNRTLDLACASAISEIFSEVIIAPDFAPDALELLRSRRRFCAGAGMGPQKGGGRRTQDRDAAAADGPGAEGHAVWLEHRQACQVERHCVRGAGPDPGHRSGPDEPGGCKPAGGVEGQGGRPGAGGQRGLQRRLFSICGWTRGGRRGRGHRGHSAGRLGARRGSDRRGGPAEPGDGLHRRAPFPALRRYVILLRL
jgi:hypothetical protein